MEKLPPIEKIYEAFSAVADHRVSMSESEASVSSSNGEKTYTVTWQGSIYTSNDSASYWQGYPGYPIIAVLMLQGKLSLDREIAGLFSGINWTELNARYKRDYAAAVRSVIQERHGDVETIRLAANKVFEEIKKLEITVKRGKLRPPQPAKK
jgi:hypothetical protein